VEPTEKEIRPQRGILCGKSNARRKTVFIGVRNITSVIELNVLRITIQISIHTDKIQLSEDVSMFN
jgi:hypothetical protein